jgi:hypothetical protein
MISTEEQQSSFRELTAQIRTAAEAVRRTAEYLSNWRPTEDDEQPRLSIEVLAQNLAAAVNLLSTKQYEAAIVESKVLKHMCDGVADLRPIGRLAAKLMGDGLRFKAGQKTPESA